MDIDFVGWLIRLEVVIVVAIVVVVVVVAVVVVDDDTVAVAVDAVAVDAVDAVAVDTADAVEAAEVVIGRDVARCNIGFVELVVVMELVVDEVDDTELADFTTR